MLLILSFCLAVVAAPGPCSYPPRTSPAGKGEAVLDMQVTCSPTSAAQGEAMSVDGKKGEEGGLGGGGSLYTDTRRQVYDMAPSASFVKANAVKVATIPRSTDLVSVSTLCDSLFLSASSSPIVSSSSFLPYFRYTIVIRAGYTTTFAPTHCTRALTGRALTGCISFLHTRTVM